MSVQVISGIRDHDRTDTTALGSFALAAMASMGAGAIHAAAVGAHAEHRQAVIAFVLVAAFQIGFGACALVRDRQVLAWIGALGNLAFIGGWILAKTSGLSFIDGLEAVEKVQLADGAAAFLAATSVMAVVVATVNRSQRSVAGLRQGVSSVAVAGLAIAGMVSAGSHAHAHAHTVTTTVGTPAAGATAGDGHVHAAEPAAAVATSGSPATTPAVVHDQGPAALVAPKVYDPLMPIDLSGVAGVTPQQQARAENLIAVTLARLPQFSDPAVAEAAGFHSIGDGLSGVEHFINRDYMADAAILDPDHPESLVYDVTSGQRKLVSAMFMLPPGSTLDAVPDIGGALTQWHNHGNLCFTTDPVAPRIADLTGSDGVCPAGLANGPAVPMIHVWIVPNVCGPFAALEGVGAGQIKPGETRLCDHAHGAGT